jgi:hypothetical protein
VVTGVSTPLALAVEAQKKARNKMPMNGVDGSKEACPLEWDKNSAVMKSSRIQAHEEGADPVEFQP